MARITYIPNRVIDSDGISDGATIAVYASGGTTPVTIYSDAALTVPVSNPYTVAVGAAVPPLFHGESGNIRVRVEDSSGNVVADDDPWAVFAADTVSSEDGNTVQAKLNSYDDVVLSLLDLSAVTSVTSATALSLTDLNKRVVCGGSTSYTVNLPATTDTGAALKLFIARDCTGVITLQAAAGSGDLVNELSQVDFIAGESATVMFDGTGWQLLDWCRVPFVAEMLNSGSTALTTDAWTQVPCPAAGAQLMPTDLKALWGFSGGYFTAPRAGTYAFTFSPWLNSAASAGQWDVGAYVGSATGGSPATNEFIRSTETTDTYRVIQYSAIKSIAKGDKIYPSVRPNSPLAGTSVEDSATLLTALRVTEVLR